METKTVQFRYTIKPKAIDMIYYALVSAYPVSRKIMLILFLSTGVIGIILGAVLARILPSFASIWEEISWIPAIILIAPIGVILYQIALLRGINSIVFEQSTWDGSELSISFLEDSFRAETKNLYREVKWDGIHGVLESNVGFSFYAHQKHILYLEKSELEPGSIPKIRDFLRNSKISQVDLLND